MQITPGSSTGHLWTKYRLVVIRVVQYVEVIRRSQCLPMVAQRVHSIITSNIRTRAAEPQRHSCPLTN
jgi:hypothetical protein